MLQRKEVLICLKSNSGLKILSPQDFFQTANDAADFLNCSHSTLYRRRCRGLITGYIVVPGRRVYLKKELRKLRNLNKSIL